MSEIDYSEYLKSADWKERSEAAKERAGRKCQVCGSASFIETHHNTYDRIGNERPEDLVVLCDRCHSLFHHKRYYDAAPSYLSAGDAIRAAVENIESFYRSKGDFTGVPSGFPALDKVLSGLQDGELVVVGARPSVGKTALALTMLLQISVERKIPAAIVSLEMSSLALMQRLIASEARVGSQKIKTGMLRPADLRALTDAAGRIVDAPFWIAEPRRRTLGSIESVIRNLKEETGIRLAFIDYFGLLASEHPWLPRHEQYAEMSRELKALAIELGIPIVLLVQVNRDAEGRRPTLGQIRDSGSIEQDADVVIFLHRDRGESSEDPGMANNVETELIVAKQRNGPVGTVRIAFIPKYARFESLDN